MSSRNLKNKTRDHTLPSLLLRDDDDRAPVVEALESQQS